MKLAYFDDFSVGVVKGDRIVDVTSVLTEIRIATGATSWPA